MPRSQPPRPELKSGILAFLPVDRQEGMSTDRGMCMVPVRVNHVTFSGSLRPGSSGRTSVEVTILGKFPVVYHDDYGPIPRGSVLRVRNWDVFPRPALIRDRMTGMWRVKSYDTVLDNGTRV